MKLLEEFGPRPVTGSGDLVPRTTVRSAAFLSDIHGNVPALTAILAELAADPVDALVLNGDITWGTWPSATIDLIEGAPVAQTILIRGNGCRAVLDLAAGLREPDMPRSTWMLAAHRPHDLDVLRRVRFQADVEIVGVGVIRCCHGSPRADIETITPGTPLERLADVTAGVDADVLLTGHTHLQFDRPVELPGRRVGRSVNPGSVGIPYGVDSPGARWLRVDAERGFDFRTTWYDVDAYIAEMLATDDPSREAVAKLLREPPTAAEIIDHAESVVFAD